MEGAQNKHLVQVPDQRLKLIVSGVVQMPLAHWQTGGINHRFGEPVSVLHYFPSQEMLPNVKSKPPHCSFEPFPHVLSQDIKTEDKTSTCWYTYPPQKAGESYEVTPRPPPLQTSWMS